MEKLCFVTRWTEDYGQIMDYLQNATAIMHQMLFFFHQKFLLSIRWYLY